jgi:hypothetical protein
MYPGGHTSTLDRYVLWSTFKNASAISTFENGTCRDQAGVEIAPQRDQQSARHCGDRNTVDSTLGNPDALAELDRQSARWGGFCDFCVSLG